MKERYKVTAIAATALATGLSAMAFVGCGASEVDEEIRITITCPDSAGVYVTDESHTNSDTVTVTCTGTSDKTSEAPVDITIIEESIESAQPDSIAR